MFAKYFIEALKDNVGIMDGDTLLSRIDPPVKLHPKARHLPQHADIPKAGHELGAELFFVRRK